MAETELEKLVVRITGDSTGLQTALAQSNKAIILLDNSIKHNTDIMKEGEKVTLSLRTAEERLGNEMGNLDYLFNKGAISTETWERGIKKATDQLKEMTKETSLFGTAFDHLGLTGLALRLKALHEAYQLGTQIGEAFGNAVFGVNALNKELERTAFLNKLVEATVGARQAVHMAEVHAIDDPQKRAAAMKDEIGKQEELIKGKRIQLGLERNALKTEHGPQMEGGIGEGVGLAVGLAQGALTPDQMGLIERQFKEMTGNKGLAQSKEQVAAATKALEEAELKLVQLRQQAAVEEVQRAGRISAYIRKLEMQTAALQGSKEAAAALRAEQLGATPEELKKIDAAAAAFDAAKKARDDAKEAERTEERRLHSIDAINKKLQEQIDTYGMSAKQLEVYKLKQLGASDADIAAAQSKADQLDALKKHDDLMKKGESVTKQFGTEEEKRAEKMKDLKELLDAGAISEDTYKRALMGTNKEKHAAQNANAAVIGSEEAYARMIEYAQKTLLVNKNSGGGPAAAGGAGTGVKLTPRALPEEPIAYVPTRGMTDTEKQFGAPWESLREFMERKSKEDQEALRKIAENTGKTVEIKIADLTK